MQLAVLANIALEYPTIYPRKITCSVILMRVARSSHTLNQFYLSVDSVSHVMLDLSKKRLEMMFHSVVLVLLAFGHGLTPVGVLASLECPRKMGSLCCGTFKSSISDLDKCIPCPANALRGAPCQSGCTCAAGFTLTNDGTCAIMEELSGPINGRVLNNGGTCGTGAASNSSCQTIMAQFNAKVASCVDELQNVSIAMMGGTSKKCYCGNKNKSEIPSSLLARCPSAPQLIDSQLNASGCGATPSCPPQASMMYDLAVGSCSAFDGSPCQCDQSGLDSLVNMTAKCPQLVAQANATVTTNCTSSSCPFCQSAAGSPCKPVCSPGGNQTLCESIIRNYCRTAEYIDCIGFLSQCPFNTTVGSSPCFEEYSPCVKVQIRLNASIAQCLSSAYPGTPSKERECACLQAILVCSPALCVV